MDSLVSPARRPRPQSRTWGLLSPSAQPPGLVWPQPGLPGLLWTVCAWGVPVPCPRTPCGRCTTLFLQKQSECERAERRASRQICQVRSNSLPQEHLSGRDEERHPVGTRNKNHTKHEITRLMSAVLTPSASRNHGGGDRARGSFADKPAEYDKM